LVTYFIFNISCVQRLLAIKTFLNLWIHRLAIPIETVSKLLGHTKLSTKQIYARVLEHKISEDIQNLLERFEKKKGKVIKPKSSRQV